MPNPNEPITFSGLYSNAPIRKRLGEFRSQQEDMKVRLATMEESRERLNNQHRELEISIDPMRRELENCKNHIIQMKEDKINEIAELNKRIQLQR